MGVWKEAFTYRIGRPLWIVHPTLPTGVSTTAPVPSSRKIALPQGPARVLRALPTAPRGLRSWSEGWLRRKGRVFWAGAGQGSVMAPPVDGGLLGRSAWSWGRTQTRQAGCPTEGLRLRRAGPAGSPRLHPDPLSRADTCNRTSRAAEQPPNEPPGRSARLLSGGGDSPRPLRREVGNGRGRMPVTRRVARPDSHKAHRPPWTNSEDSFATSRKPGTCPPRALIAWPVGAF